MQAAIEARLRRLVAGPYHTGAVLGWSRNGVTEFAAAGDLGPDDPYFAASCTKLVTTVLVRMLADAGRLDLDQPFLEVLADDGLERLCVWRGEDLTGRITIRHLLQHRSGLPDYLESAREGRGLLGELMAGRDRGWTLAEVAGIARRQGPVGRPGEMRRAHYSDTNFQILGRVIEVLSGRSFAAEARARVFAPLGLEASYVYADPADRRPRVMRHGAGVLDVPKAMASFQADGGLVTTARDGVRLVAGLFGGALLPRDWWRAHADWRPVFFPMRYGTGLMMYRLPRLMTGFRAMRPLIGHGGLSGAVMFHDPETGLALAGTVNQAGRRSTVYRLAAAFGLDG